MTNINRTSILRFRIKSVTLKRLEKSLPASRIVSLLKKKKTVVKVHFVNCTTDVSPSRERS